MGYELMGLLHARAATLLHAARGRLAGQAGQGTVEYVALMLLIAGVFAVVVKAAGGTKGGETIAKTIVDKLQSTLNSVK
jgi:hypothetical protein